MKKHAAGRQIAGCIIALLLIPAQMMLTSLSFVVLPQPIIIAVMHAWAGPVAAAFAAVSAVIAAYTLFNHYVAWASAILYILPACVVIWQINKRVSYFKRIRTAVIVQFTAILGVLVAVYMVLRVDLMDALVVYIRSSVESQPPVVIDMMYEMFIQTGYMIGNGAQQLTSERLQAIIEMVESTSAMLKIAVPGFVIISSLVTGMLSTVASSAICVRRGDEPAVPYVPLSDWYVPNHVMLGLFFSVLFTALLENFGLTSAPVSDALMSLINAALTIQASAFIARMLRMRGTRRGARNFLLVVGILFFGWILRLVGAYISIFGRRGIVADLLRKVKNRRNGEGNE